jgi:hypothetical protein
LRTGINDIVDGHNANVSKNVDMSI